MKIKDFMSQLESSKDLAGIGMVMGEKQDGEVHTPTGVSHVVIKHAPTSVEIKLPTDAIRQSDWETPYGVMSGKREPFVLQHMTRVVGYYSKIENWNPSKVGELNDRQKGDYELKDQK